MDSNHPFKCIACECNIPKSFKYDWFLCHHHNNLHHPLLFNRKWIPIAFINFTKNLFTRSPWLHSKKITVKDQNINANGRTISKLPESWKQTIVHWIRFIMNCYTQLISFRPLKVWCKWSKNSNKSNSICWY